MSRARRSFSAEFKARVVLDLLTGATSQAEICRKYHVSVQLLAYWKATFLQRLPSLFEGDDRGEEQRQRMAELEQLIGRQALELEILKKASRLLSGPTRRNGRSS